MDIPLEFVTTSDRIIKVFQELTERVTERMSIEDMEEKKFATRVSLRVSFTEEEFSFLYYNLMDMLSEIGGLGGAVAGTLSSFAVYIMMLFVFDLIGIIKRKYKQEKRMHNLAIISKKLPEFYNIVNSKIAVIKNELKNNELADSSEEDKMTPDQKKYERTKEATNEALEKELAVKEVNRASIINLIKQMKIEVKGVYSKSDDFEEENKEPVDEDELIDEQEKELMRLDERYKKDYAETGREQKDIFDELNVTKKLLNERHNYSIMHIVDLIKKRISFFGVYSIHD